MIEADLVAEVRRLREVLNGVVRAWELLPVDTKYEDDAQRIFMWLRFDMKPKIDDARAALHPEPTND